MKTKTKKHVTFSPRCWCKPKIKDGVLVHNRAVPKAMK